MSGESRSDNNNLGVGRISRLVERSVVQSPSITTVRQGGRERAINNGSSLVVPFRVPSLDDIAGSPLDSSDVLVRVGARHEQGSVGKEEGGGVVHSLVR